MKDNKILVLKGLAIIGVVLQHILNRRFDEQTLEWLSFFSGLFGWCVLLFLATAGWLHSLSVEKSEKVLSTFVGVRARRLLLPWLGLILFYSGCWHILQMAGIGGIATRQDPSFWGKVHDSLLLNSGAVAEQLYFLPLLFLISTLLHCFWQSGRRGGVVLYVGLAFFASCWQSGGANTGPNLSLLSFGALSYGMGFLMHSCRGSERWRLGRLVTMGLTLYFFGLSEGAIKVFPLLLLEACLFLRFDRASWLVPLGEASGTIYAYHTPFVLQPLVILSACLPLPLGGVGAVAAAVVVLISCSGIHYGLRNTTLRRILL